MEIRQELDIDYLGSNYQFFVPNVIDRIQLEDVREPLVRGELRYNPATGEPEGFDQFPDGRIQLWFNLTPEGGFPEGIECVLGNDVSAGTGASNSVSSGVSRETGEKLLEFAYPGPDFYPEAFAVYATAIAKWMNNAYLIWDASGPTGRIFGNRVMDLKYTFVYWKTALNRITRKPSETPGYFLNPGDKAEAFGRYRRALKEGTFVQRSYEANKECLSYIQVVGGKGIEHAAALNCQDPTGARDNHGDRCVADVMANYGLYVLKDSTIVTPKEVVPYFSYAGRKARQEAKLREREEVWA